MTTTYNDDDDDNNNINNTMRSDKENVLPSVKKSFSQFEHADDEYFDDDYAVCSDMLNDRNMFHCIAPRYHVPHVQRASPVIREMWDQPRAFRPIIFGVVVVPCCCRPKIGRSVYVHVSPDCCAFHSSGCFLNSLLLCTDKRLAVRHRSLHGSAALL